MLVTATASPVVDLTTEGAEKWPAWYEESRVETDKLAEEIERILAEAEQDRAREQADKNVKDAIRRRVAEREAVALEAPTDLVVPQINAAPQRSRLSLLLGRGNSILPVGGSDPPDFWQRNRWAWPAVQWITFLSLIGLCIGAARWGRRAK